MRGTPLLAVDFRWMVAVGSPAMMSFFANLSIETERAEENSEMARRGTGLFDRSG
jgi:hypothetical protein